jgi:hypothetical protein
MVTGSALTRNSATAGHTLIEPEPLAENRDHSLASQAHAAEPDDVSVFSPVSHPWSKRICWPSQAAPPV